MGFTSILNVCLFRKSSSIVLKTAALKRNIVLKPIQLKGAQKELKCPKYVCVFKKTVHS